MTQLEYINKEMRIKANFDLAKAFDSNYLHYFLEYKYKLFTFTEKICSSNSGAILVKQGDLPPPLLTC